MTTSLKTNVICPYQLVTAYCIVKETADPFSLTWECSNNGSANVFCKNGTISPINCPFGVVNVTGSCVCEGSTIFSEATFFLASTSKETIRCNNGHSEQVNVSVVAKGIKYVGFLLSEVIVSPQDIIY